MQPVSPEPRWSRHGCSRRKQCYYSSTTTSLAEARTPDMTRIRSRPHLRPPRTRPCPAIFLQRRLPGVIRTHSQDPAQRCVPEGWAYYARRCLCGRVIGNDLDARCKFARLEAGARSAGDRDPKLASGEWTYEQAAAYARESGFTREAAGAAAAAIRTNPGYSCIHGRPLADTTAAVGLPAEDRRPQARCTIFMTGLLSYGCTPWPSWAGTAADLDESRRAQCGRPRAIEVQKAHAPPVSELTSTTVPRQHAHLTNSAILASHEQAVVRSIVSQCR